MTLRWRSLSFVAAALLVTAAVGSADALAQAGDNEYYASRGSALLRTVEQYHLYPGEQSLREKHYLQAFHDAEFILRYFPNHPRGLLLMVQTCAEWKSPSCYLEPVLEKAIAIKPDQPGTHIVNGIYQHRSKRYKEAIAAFERALELDPNSMNGHYNLALAYLDTRQFALANEHAQRAYKLGATLPGLRHRLQQAKQWKPLEPEDGAPDAVQPPPTTAESSGDGTSASAPAPR
jgi:tetratricopeptide (TPR) repeat protein